MHNQVQVLHYDAFSTVPGKGNPAGIVLMADALSTEQMQEIARQVGFNETAFVLRSDRADVRLRFFTPGHEMNLCGHGTVATLAALKERGHLGQADSDHLVMECSAGLLPIHVQRSRGQVLVGLQQASPVFRKFGGRVDQLAAAIGLTPADLDPQLPIVYGSTGTWTLLVPIRERSAFPRMQPQNEAFPAILQEMPRASVHPFCLQAHDPMASMHARHFSSPFSGTTEDPVTGTASGVMGAYLLTFVEQQAEHAHLWVEQGQEMGRDGRALVEVNRFGDDLRVRVAGTAVHVAEWSISLDA